MKQKKSAKKVTQLAIGANASGALLLTDGQDNWWKVGTKNATVDLEKLKEDCKSILSGTHCTPYLQYIGKDEVDFDDTDTFLDGWLPFGYFQPSRMKIDIYPRLAGPDNLLLFGKTKQIAKLPDAVAHIHREMSRICEKLIAKANEAQSADNLASEFYRLVIDNIAVVKFQAFMDELDELPDWFDNNIWEMLSQMSGLMWQDKPVSALPLYIAAYELDGVCLPVPDAIIEDFKNDSNENLVFSLHQSRKLDDAWAKADCQSPALLESLQHFYSEWVDRDE